jgi:hypothetical protein
MTDLYISLAVILALRIWNAKLIQTWVSAKSLKLPQWAQPIPPMVLSIGATVVLWLVQGVSNETLQATLLDGGINGALTLGAYHIAKRWIPAVAISKIAKASVVSLAAFAFAGCSSTLEQSRSEGLSRLTRGPAIVTMATRNTARCHQLSDREANWKAVETVSGAFAVGFASAAWPVESDRWEMVVVGTGVAGAAVTAYAESRRRSAQEAWAEECSQ